MLSLFTFFIFFFSLLHHQTTSLPSHAPLSLCQNTTFTCGTIITNLSYPFTGGNRPSFCGPPQFRLTCNDAVPVLNISSLSYRVIKLDSVSQTLTLARSDLWNEACTKVHLNSTFDDGTKIFSYGFGNENLTLLYGCGPSCGLREKPNNLFHCVSYGDKNDSYSLVGPFPSDPFLSVVQCDYKVEVPILEEQGNRLIGNRSLLREVLMMGFNLNYSDPFEDECGECRGIGGQCGFDSESDESICICGDRLCPSSGSSSWQWNWKIKNVVSPAVCVFVVILGVVICNHKKYFSLSQGRLVVKKTGTSANHNVEDFINNYGLLAPKRYSYSEVKRITNSFRDQLGQGGYGVVYKGSLPDGRHVAVKMISESKGNGEDFINEVASISRTSHINIVSLFGFCNEMDKRALIYEFMPNGSLDKFIYKHKSSNAICDLDWKTLYQITISIARGLEYLHRGCNTRTLHLDIKPQNILLDEDFCPKIADFGLAKICKKKESIVSVLGTRGTPGYIAPEVFSRIFGGVSHKSDVYSYGMLILEVVGGKKNYDNRGSNTSELYFPDWIYKDFEQDNIPAMCLVDTKEENDMVMKITLVSMWCIQLKPSDRPSMNKVVKMLEGSLQSVPYPPKPVMNSLEGSLLQFSDISSNLHETDSIVLPVENSSIK